MKTYYALGLALMFSGAACTTDVTGHFDPSAGSRVKIVGLFDQSFQIYELAANASTVYMLGKDTLRSCPTAGCVPAGTIPVLASRGATRNAGTLRVSALGAFWTALDPNDSLKLDLLFCPAAGCANGRSTVLSSSSGVAYAVDDTFVYFVADAALTKLQRCDPVDCGGTAITLVQGAQSASAAYSTILSIVASDQTVYFYGMPYGSNGGSIFSCPSSGCGAAAPRRVVGGLDSSVLAAGSAPILGVASGNLYYLDHFPHERPDRVYQVQRCALPDCAGGPQFILPLSQDNVSSGRSYVFAKGQVLWVDLASTALFSCSDQSCSPQPQKIDGLAYQSPLATDGASVFFLESYPFQIRSNGVMRLDL